MTNKAHTQKKELDGTKKHGGSWQSANRGSRPRRSWSSAAGRVDIYIYMRTGTRFLIRVYIQVLTWAGQIVSSYGKKGPMRRKAEKKRKKPTGFSGSSPYHSHAADPVQNPTVASVHMRHWASKIIIRRSLLSEVKKTNSNTDVM